MRFFSTAIFAFATFVSVSFCINAFALPPGDARSIAMAGTGVASANGLSAPFHNPALLSLPSTQSGWAYLMPYFGLSGALGETLLQDILNIADNRLIAELDAAITEYNQFSGVWTEAELNRTTTRIISLATELDRTLTRLDRQAARIDAAVSISAARPNQDRGIALFHHSSIRALAMIEYRDSQVINNYIDLARAAQANQVSGDHFNAFKGQLASDGRIIGLAMLETGFSLSTATAHSWRQGLSIGISPKLIQMISFDYETSIDDFSKDRFQLSDYSTQSSVINLDAGFAFQHGTRNEWTLGGSVKNLLTHTLVTDTGHRFHIKPQVQAGVAYEDAWYRWSAELDIVPTQPLNLEGNTAFLSTGIEATPWSWLSLRGGWRLNVGSGKQTEKSLANSSVITVGLGFNVRGFRSDLAIIAGRSALGMGLQFAYLKN